MREVGWGNNARESLVDMRFLWMIWERIVGGHTFGGRG